MAEEIVTTSSRELSAKRPEPRGLTPLQAGLMWGAGGAAIGGPIGLLAGVLAGVVAKRSKENYLDRVAADMHNMRREYEVLNERIDEEYEIADPDEQRLLQDAKDVAANGWYRLQSGDETGRQLIEQAHETIRGIMNADIQARKSEQAAQFNAQRGLVSSAATTLRDQYSTTLTAARQVDSQAQRILELTADPNFDPDKPFHKAVLAELVSTSIGGMYKDDPNGLLNGLAELGSTGSEIGTVIGGLAKLGKSVADKDDFKISREEYNRIALNIRKVTQTYGQKRMMEIEQQATGLNDFGRKTGLIPQDYSLADYVSGGVRELQLAPAAIPNIRPLDTKQPIAARRTPSWTPPRRQQIVAPELQPLTPEKWTDDWFRQKLGVPTQKQRRPTN